MATYDRFVSMAVRLINQWGVSVTMRREVDTLNPDNGSVVESPAIDQSVYGIFVPGNKEKTLAFFPGQLVQATDRQMIVAALSYDFTPEPGDQIHLPDGRDYDIVALVPIDPDSTAIVYRLLLRG